ncbi:MAG: FHA domain-containing protein [Xanthomonadaceae bacterium]|nr:FHA domain-containing protein [Xanthomonadaceae bacterium]MDE1884527.1 FHA domain-containing protein [Xanthomonadaceae bacterium]MDE1960212.1 FHA domain-containing protein [Xanthomonadaceae bacterium]MDE2083811.1 FHA domain-containing protein [Xanthomonadaceae bacterium]
MGTNENEWQGALSAIDLSAIESLKKLKQENDQLGERLKSMEAMKSNFADAVYVRVRADYEKRIAALDAEAAPLKQAAREQYARLRALLGRFEADHEAVKLDQQELELRHQLGEFDDKEFAKRMKTIETAVAERGQARSRGLELKARFLEAFHSESELERADTGGTGRFSVADLAAAQARTQEVATVIGGEAPPNKTQTMSAIDIPEPPRTPAPPPAPPAAGGATQIFRAARLVPQNPEAGKQTYTLTLKPIDIGADTANDVRIGGPGVDPKHAKIVVSMGGFTIVDLGSKHGTRVNAEKVRERPLANEDVIQIGAARFVFREG